LLKKSSHCTRQKGSSPAGGNNHGVAGQLSLLLLAAEESVELLVAFSVFFVFSGEVVAVAPVVVEPELLHDLLL